MACARLRLDLERIKQMIDIDDWLGWASKAMPCADSFFGHIIHLVEGVEEFRQNWPTLIHPSHQQGRWR